MLVGTPDPGFPLTNFIKIENISTATRFHSSQEMVPSSLLLLLKMLAIAALYNLLCQPSISLQLFG